MPAWTPRNVANHFDTRRQRVSVSIALTLVPEFGRIPSDPSIATRAGPLTAPPGLPETAPRVAARVCGGGEGAATAARGQIAIE